MAKTLEAAKTLAGVCGTGSAISYHISGDEVSGTTSTFKELAAGFIPTSAATIYTPPSGCVVSEIVLVNTTGSPVSGLKLFQGGLNPINQILAQITLPADGTLTINGAGIQVVDGNGAQQVTFGALTFLGDVTGSGTSPITLTLATVNASPGTFGSATQVGTFTVNGKGLVTAVVNQAIAITASQVTNFDTQVRTSRIDQMATPNTDVPWGSHKITSVLDPTNPQDVATKNYVDTIAAGVRQQHYAQVAKDTNQASLTGLPTVDTITLTDSQSILLTAQSTASQNGLWLVHAGAWTRPTWFATGSDATGSYVFIQQGTVYGGSEWFLLGAGPITVDTSNETWQEVTGAFDITVDATLVKTGNLITRAAITGDVAIASGSNASVLATVNANVGAFGSATQVGTFTVNGKGLTTAAANVAIQIAESQVTNLTTDLAGKQATGNYITALTGDGAASGPGSAALTLATVNAAPGTVGDSSHVAQVTVNAKGLVTTAVAVSVTPAAIGAVPTSRLITTTLPLRIAGGTSSDLSADRLLTIDPATALLPGSMSASDFNRDRKEWDAYGDFGLILNLRTAAEVTASGTQVVMTSGSNIVNIPNAGATTPVVAGRDEGKRVTVQGAGVGGAVLDGFIGVVNSTSQFTVLATVGGAALNASTTVTASTSVAVFVQWGTDNSSAVAAMVTTINNQSYPTPKITWGKTGLSDWTNAIGFKNPVVFNKVVWWEGTGGSHTADVGDYTKLGGTRWAWWGTSSDGGVPFGAMVTVTPPASGAATPAFVRSATTATTVTSASAVGNLPSAPSNGNMLIAEVSAGQPSETITPPTGWTLLSGPLAGGGTTYTTWLYWKVASAEPSTWTWTLGSLHANCVTVSEYTGVSTAAPTVGAAAAAGTNTINSPVITTPANNSIVIQGVSLCNGFTGAVITIANPANTTQESQGGTNILGNTAVSSQLSHDTVNQAVAGSTAARTFTASASVTNLEAWTIAMAPAAGGAAVPSITRPQFSHGWFDGRNGDQNQALYLLKLASCQGAALNGGLFFMDALAQGLWLDISTTPTEAKDTTRFRFQELCFRQLDNNLVTPPTTTPTTLTAVASAGVLPTTVGIVLTLTSVTGFTTTGGYAWVESIIGQPILIKYGAVSGSTLTGCIVSAEDVVNTPTTYVNAFIVPCTPGNGGAIKLAGGSGANTCCGSINDIQVSYGLTWGPAAVEFSNSDSISGSLWMMNGGSNVTEANGNRQRRPGVRFNGSNVSQTLASRNNVLRDVDPGGAPGGPLGGISFMGAKNDATMMAFPSGPNYVEMMQMGNGSPVPTAEIGAFYDWTGNGLWKPGPAAQTGSVVAQALTAAVGNIVNGSIINVPPQGWQIGTRLAWDIPIHKIAGGGLSFSVGIRQHSALVVGGGTLIATCTYTSTNVPDGGQLHLELVCVGPLGGTCAAAGQFVLTHDLAATGFSTGVTAPVSDTTAVSGTVRTRPTMATFNSAAAAGGPTFLFVEINPITAASVMTVDPPVGVICIKAANP